jgi:hypothetical protein
MHFSHLLPLQKRRDIPEIPNDFVWNPSFAARYAELVDIELITTSDNLNIDLTGLPDPVVQDIRRLVKTLRESLSSQKSEPHVECGPLRGRFANQTLSIPKEDIDEAQRAAWSGFPRDFPETPDKL